MCAFDPSQVHDPVFAAIGSKSAGAKTGGSGLSLPGIVHMHDFDSELGRASLRVGTGIGEGVSALPF